METFKSLRESWWWLEGSDSDYTLAELKDNIKNATAFSESSAKLAAWDALKIFGYELYFYKGWDSYLETSEVGAYLEIKASINPEEFVNDPKIKGLLHELDEVMELCNFNKTTVEDHDGLAVGIDY